MGLTRGDPMVAVCVKCGAEEGLKRPIWGGVVAHCGETKSRG